MDRSAGPRHALQPERSRSTAASQQLPQPEPEVQNGTVNTANTADTLTADGSTPKRRKRNNTESRQRVTRACDRCKRRKVRCTGVKPCEICIDADAQCTYDLSYARGRLPLIPTSNGAGRHSNQAREDSPGNSDATTGGRLSYLSTVTTTETGRPVDAIDASDVQGSTATTADTAHAASSRVSPEPSQTDLQGHYVGPSSGVSFLLRVQKRLHEAVSFSQTSSIFTFGDAPLPEYDSSIPLLLSRGEATTLLERYFNFAAPTHRFLHQPTVESWLHEFYESKGRMSSRDDGRAKLAVLFMIFAQAREYMLPSTVSPNMDSSAQYYLAAEQQLSKEKGSIRLASVQARLGQCFYLLSQSRINHCWTLFGTTAHLALAIGMNRNRRADPAGGLGHIDVECRRRTFWCSYNLDNYLSAALGRPRTYHDEDIDQELPTVVEDCDLFHNEIRPSQARGQSIMLAPVAHVRLSKIVGMILRELYSIRPISASTRASLTTKHSEALEVWRIGMARFLDADHASAALQMPVFQRQRNVLNLAYWHAVLLTHRPLLLSNFAYLQRQGSDSRDESSRAHAQSSMQQCLSAAMHIIEIVDDLFQADQLFQAYWFTMYFAFSAVVVVYVYVIQNRASPPETYRRYFSAAIECQNHIASRAVSGSLTQRYSLVLEELRSVTARQTEPKRQTNGQTDQVPVAVSNANGSHDAGNVSYAPNGDNSSQTIDQGHGGISHVYADVPGIPGGGSFDLPNVSMNGGLGNWNESPSSSLADVTSWGHFDSMVSSGFWPLESLINDEQLMRPL